MKVLRLAAQNVKRIRVIDITPTDDPIVHITGRNGQGKSSVLDCILYALGGVDTLPSKPVRMGEDTAAVQLDLGEYIVRRTWTPEKGTQLFITDKIGSKITTPQTIINGFMSKITLDPLEFARMKPVEQAEKLRSLVKLSVDPDELDAANKRDYDERRIVKRDHAKLLAQFEGLPTVPSGVPEAETDVSALAGELQKAGEHNSKIEAAKAQKAMHERRAASFGDEQAEAASKIKEARQNIAKWEKEQEQAQLTLKAETKKAAAVEIPKPIDTSAIAQTIKDAELNNSWVKRRAEAARMKAELEAMTVQEREYDAKMKEREELKREAFEQAEMPIDGLTYTAEGVSFNGLPLDQASGAERLRVSMMIAMAGNPKLRVLRIVDGSLLDDDSLELVRQEARKRDFQVWIEGVDASGEVGFVMEDGAIASSPQSRAGETEAQKAEIKAPQAETPAVKSEPVKPIRRGVHVADRRGAK